MQHAHLPKTLTIQVLPFCVYQRYFYLMSPSLLINVKVYKSIYFLAPCHRSLCLNFCSLFLFPFSSSVFSILFFHRLYFVLRLKTGSKRDKMCFGFKVKLNVADLERIRYDVVENLNLNSKRETTTKREAIGNNCGVSDCIHLQASQRSVFQTFLSWCCIPVDS